MLKLPRAVLVGCKALLAAQSVQMPLFDAQKPKSDRFIIHPALVFTPLPRIDNTAHDYMPDIAPILQSVIGMATSLAAVFVSTRALAHESYQYLPLPNIV